MKVCLLNECEVCGRRWAPEALKPRHAATVSYIISMMDSAPSACFICNPAPWLAHFNTTNETATQRLRGEGYIRLDGNGARNPETVPKD